MLLPAVAGKAGYASPFQGGSGSTPIARFGHPDGRTQKLVVGPDFAHGAFPRVSLHYDPDNAP